MISKNKISTQRIPKKLDFYSKTLSYYTAGEGKALILLHGYLDSALIWDPIGNILAKDFKVITIDLPGHGNSSAWPPVHTMEFMAEAVAKIIHHEEIKNACIIGHSLGGYVALALAKSYPEFISSLILINSDPLADTPERSKKRDREITLIKAGKKELLLSLTHVNPFAIRDNERSHVKGQQLIESGLNIQDDAIIATIEGMKLRADQCNFLKKSCFPTLFLLGKKDPQLNYAKVMKKTKPIETIHHIILENSAHSAITEEPEFVLQHIRKFCLKN
jgi:pimeloyl-ACP methyl ester carboxylesterase